MKVKPLYIYLVAFVVLIAALVFFTDSAQNGKPDPNSTKEIPDDDVHSQFKSDGMGEPSKNNVMTEAIKKLELLKAEVDKNPNDTLKVREYADMLTMAHKPDEAAKYYNTILKKDPKRIDILMQLTLVYYQMGDLIEAEKYTNNILKVDPKNAIGFFNLAVIAQAKGDLKKAEELMMKVAKENPKTEIGHMADQSVIQLRKLKEEKK